MKLDRCAWSQYGAVRFENGLCTFCIWSKLWGDVSKRRSIDRIVKLKDRVYGYKCSDATLAYSAHPFYVVRGDRETEA